MNMFKKKKLEPVRKNISAVTLPEKVVPAVEAVEAVEVVEKENRVGTQSTRHCTVVAQNTLFTGNITLEGDMHVYGKILGNITLTNGILHVMRDGFIEGEFNAPSIIINGRVQGTCIGDKIEILEHGEMDGMSRSTAFSIRPGGCFIGHSERLTAALKEPQPEHTAKNKKNQRDKTVETSTVIALAQNK